MALLNDDLIDNTRLAGYKKCEKCNATFEKLYIGGDGDWRQTIMCEMCFHVRRAIPLQIIHELIAQQYPSIGTVEKAKKVDEESQRRYQAVLAKYAVDPTAKVAG
jgi:hypothetical protein